MSPTLKIANKEHVSDLMPDCKNIPSEVKVFFKTLHSSVGILILANLLKKVNITIPNKRSMVSLLSVGVIYMVSFLKYSIWSVNY